MRKNCFISSLLVAALSFFVFGCTKNSKQVEQHPSTDQATIPAASAEAALANCPKGYMWRMDQSSNQEESIQNRSERNDTNRIHPNCVPVRNYGENEPEDVDSKF